MGEMVRIKDAEYRLAVRALIPEAKDFADDWMKEQKYKQGLVMSHQREEYNRLWDQVYHAEMDRLCEVLGIRTMLHPCQMPIVWEDEDE